MGILSFLWGATKETYAGGENAVKEAKFTAGQMGIQSLYVTDNEIWPVWSNYTKDRQFAKPKGVDKLFRRPKKIYSWCGKMPIAIYFEDNVDSIDFTVKPEFLPPEKIAKLDKEHKKLLEIIENISDEKERERALNSISLADWHQKGAAELNSFSDDMINNSDVRITQSLSKAKMLYMIIICLLVGFIIGGFLTALITAGIIVSVM